MREYGQEHEKSLRASTNIFSWQAVLSDCVTREFLLSLIQLVLILLFFFYMYFHAFYVSAFLIQHNAKVEKTAVLSSLFLECIMNVF